MGHGACFFAKACWIDKIHIHLFCSLLLLPFFLLVYFEESLHGMDGRVGNVYLLSVTGDGKHCRV
jgi:hypothetical protein